MNSLQEKINFILQIFKPGLNLQISSVVPHIVLLTSHLLITMKEIALLRALTLTREINYDFLIIPN